jgi:hypothetical protein
MRNVSAKMCGVNQNTHFMFSNFFPENISVYQVIWKNIVEPSRPQVTIRLLRISRWLPKATNIHSKYETLTAFSLQQWLHNRASLLRYTYIAWPVIT